MKSLLREMRNDEAIASNKRVSQDDRDDAGSMIIGLPGASVEEQSVTATTEENEDSSEEEHEVSRIRKLVELLTVLKGEEGERKRMRKNVDVKVQTLERKLDSTLRMVQELEQRHLAIEIKQAVTDLQVKLLTEKVEKLTLAQKKTQISKISPNESIRTDTRTTEMKQGLQRVYVAQWNDDYEGAIKSDLRESICTHWGSNSCTYTGDEFNVVRYINKIGAASDNPVIEILCTADKEEVLKNYFISNNIEVLPSDYNPFLASQEYIDDDPVDVQNDYKRFEEVLEKWFISSQRADHSDTKKYYRTIMRAAVRGRTELHQWPAHITGVTIKYSASEYRPIPNVDFMLEKEFADMLSSGKVVYKTR